MSDDGSSCAAKEVAPDTNARSSEPLIRLNAIEMIYRTKAGAAVKALEKVDLDIENGEFVTIVGPSGCGKTTLLRVVGGLIKKTSGVVSLAGREVDGPNRDIGIVFQGPVLLPWRTVLENVMLPVNVLGLDIDKHTRRANELLDMVGLEGFADKYPNELSGGMQQRVSIARALIHDPSLLLMDEPFGALDALTREMMNLELQRIARDAGKTVLFITHSIQEAVFLGDRVVVMTPRPGKIARIIAIELERPRDLDLAATERFGVYVKDIRHLLNAQGLT